AVTDSAVFHPRRSGRDALRVLCALGGIPSRRADEVIDLVELTAPVDGTSAATRWACGSDWPWPPRSWATPRPWCSTSRPPDWTRPACCGYAPCCAAWPSRDAPYWCPATCSPKRRRPSTT